MEHRRSILLVEDEDLIALTTREILKKYQFDVIHVSNGKAALAAVKQNQFDLILMDIELGDDSMDGTQTAQDILEIRDIPIVFYTGHTEKEFVNRVKAISKYGFVLKSSGEYVLIEAINTAFQLFQNFRKYRDNESAITQEVINSSPVIAFIWENKTGWPVTFVTRNIKHHMGYDANELINNHVNFQSLIHPDDLPRFTDELEESNSNEQSTQFFHAPYRILTREGVEKWCDDHTTIIRDEDGKITHYRGVIIDISSKKDKDQRFREIVESSREGIWVINEDAETSYVNPRMADMLGYQTEEMLGKHLFDFMGPKERETAYLQLEKRKAGVTEQHEFTFQKKHGEDLHVLLEATPIIDSGGNYKGALASIMDISRLKESEKALRLNEQKWRTLVEKNPDCIAVIDGNGEIQYTNRYSEKYLCPPRQSTSVFDSLPKEIEETLRDNIVRCLQHKETIKFIYTLETMGQTVWYENYLIPITFEKDSMIYISRDITDKKKSEVELNELLKEKELLLKEVNHRVKNNLSIITGLISLQVENTDDIHVRRALQTFQNRIGSILNVYTALQHDHSIDLVDVGKYLNNLISDIQKIHHQDGVTISCNNPPIQLNGQSLIFLGIIINELITNAIKYAFPGTEKGSVLIEITEEEDDQLKLSVIDDGIGIPENPHESRSSGLGMTIIQALVDQIKGSLAVVPRRKGTQFDITFPRPS